jgi:hypothetical protein
MSASSSTSTAAEQVAALSLADALQSGFTAQRAGHQRRFARPLAAVSAAAEPADAVPAGVSDGRC